MCFGPDNKVRGVGKMNDASRIQQINNMARELMKHGQASTMDDAMKKAQAQLNGQPGGRIPAPAVSLSNPSSEAPKNFSSDSHLAGADISQNGSGSSDACCDDAMKNQVMDTISKHQTTLSHIVNTVNMHSESIEKFDAKLNSLIQDIADLKQKVQRLGQRPADPQPVKEAGPAVNVQTAPEQKSQQAQSGGHVRSGNYKSDDVSIEKFFYFGHK